MYHVSSCVVVVGLLCTSLTHAQALLCLENTLHLLHGLVVLLASRHAHGVPTAWCQGVPFAWVSLSPAGWSRTPRTVLLSCRLYILNAAYKCDKEGCSQQAIAEVQRLRSVAASFDVI